MASEPDKEAFSLNLLGQTVTVWATSGFCAGATVSIGAFCGVSMVLAAATAVLGLLFIGGLAVTGTPDRWRRLRWVNHFLQQTFGVVPLFTAVGMLFLVSTVNAMRHSDIPADRPPESGNFSDYLIVRAAILLSLVVGVAVKLTRVWEKVRDADQPTDLKK